VDAHTFTKQVKKVSINIVCLPESDGNCFLEQERVLMMEFMQQMTTISEAYCETLKKLQGDQFRTKVWNANILCSPPP
jgi:hypothetical protein